MNRAELISRLKDLKPQLARDYGVVDLAVFGSHARDEAHLDSDIDLLVTLIRPLGFKFLELEDTLSAALGADVDLCTEVGLHRLVRRKARAEAIRVD
jgi:uncharacterized protein